MKTSFRNVVAVLTAMSGGGLGVVAACSVGSSVPSAADDTDGGITAGTTTENEMLMSGFAKAAVTGKMDNDIWALHARGTKVQQYH